jgi:NADH-quinone oxidoreductase subunit J
MLMNLSAEAESKKSNLIKLSAVIAGGSLGLIILAGIKQTSITIANNQMLSEGNIGSIKMLGKVLYTDYILPFEVASILFLVAMIGAVILGKKEKDSLTIGHQQLN